MENKTTNIITAVLSAISTAFSKFVGVFKKNGLVYTMIVLMFFVLTYSLIINPIRLDSIIEERLQHQWEKEQVETAKNKITEENNRIDADAFITPLMEDISDKYNIDRILLFEAHNNSQNISGTPFLFYSASYEVININDYSLDYISDSFQRQYQSNFLAKETYIMLQHKDFITYENLKDYKRNKSRLLVKLKRNNVNNVMLIPFRNRAKQPVIIMAICNNDTIKASEIYDYIKPQLNNISQSLING